MSYDFQLLYYTFNMSNMLHLINFYSYLASTYIH